MPVPSITGAVFLSYAREDAAAVRRLAEALRASGVEVWFDESELRGGDAWDAKIRQQIRACALFLPIISKSTQARREGYFRLEWHLAEQRSLLMAKGTPFIMPVCIDDTNDWNAIVPDSFMSVQWTRLRQGLPTFGGARGDQGNGGQASGDASVAAFCALVKNLLADEAALRPEQAASEPRSPRTPAVPARRRWPLALVAAGAIAPAVALMVYLSNSSKTSVEQKTPSSKAPAGRVALSEARQLAAKATALIEQGEQPTRETLALAEKFCQQASTLDPNDAEIWAISSRVGSLFIFWTMDRSEERRVQAGNAASRAMRLAPDSFEARFAQANFYRLDDATYREAEAILRKLIEERPNDPRLWRTLGSTLRYGTISAGTLRGREEEAVECYRRALDLTGGEPVTLSGLATALAVLGRIDEAEKAANESIALNPRGHGYFTKMSVMLRYAGDATKAREALVLVPAELLRDDRGAYAAAETFLCAREYDKAVEFLKTIPRDYLEAAFDGPKSALIAQAHKLAGRPRAAEIEWRAALQVVERRLASQPNHVRLLIWKSRLLASLRELTEARRLFEAVEQLGLSPRDSLWAAPIALELGDREKAISLLSAAVEARVVRRAFLRIDPTWDALRGDPQFEALLREPQNGAAKSAQTSAPADQKSIAVLAFENRSSEKDSEYFSDGVSEELLNVLSKVPGLRVAPRTSSFYYKGRKTTTGEIGRTLNVAHIVEGSVQRMGSRARITAQLSRIATGELLWSDKFDTELKDIFAAQDEIAGFIARKLSLTLGAPPRAAKTVDPEAYRFMLEGRHFLSLRDGGFTQAEGAFSRALQIDPQFAPAHAGLAGLHVLRWVFRFDEDFPYSAADLRAGRQAAERAIARDPELVDAHAILGYGSLLEGRLAESGQHFQRGLGLNPNDAFTRHWHAHLLARMGRLDLALEENERAALCDPLAFSMLYAYAFQLLHARRFDQALDVIQRSLALRANFAPSRGVGAMALLGAGRREDAVAAARAIRKDTHSSPRFWGDLHAVWVLHQAGLKQEAESYASELLEKWPAGSWKRPSLYAVLGRFDEALAPGETLPSDSFSALIYFWGPAWDPVRNDARFMAKISELGLKDEYQIARETLTRMEKERTAKK